MNEEWKLITCLKYREGMRAAYEVSNLGRIRNKRTKRIVKPHKHNSGYYSFMYRYYNENGEQHFTCMLWHRIVATMWLDNPDNLPQIDHINHDVSDNRVENLRWASAKDNAANTRPRSNIRYSRKKPTKVIDREGNVIAEYNTLEEACKDYGVSIPHALEMLHGRRLPKAWGTFQQKPSYVHAKRKN